tara:strand:- start:174 stop:398 length:225 start_codon:yes stop_codon:yes gene_type:complete
VQGSKAPALFGIGSQIASRAGVHALIGIELGKKIIAFSTHHLHAVMGCASEIDHNVSNSVSGVFGALNCGLALR